MAQVGPVGENQKPMIKFFHDRVDQFQSGDRVQAHLPVFVNQNQTTRGRGRQYNGGDKTKTLLKRTVQSQAMTKIIAGDHRFLILSDRPDLSHAIFQEYLCLKLLSLKDQNWQLDVHDREAHIEIHQEILNAHTLASCLKGLFELLNNVMVVTKSIYS